MTMNNHWGYNKNDQNWKSSTTLIRNLIDCASKGGNYLLNIGPTSEGVFPEASIERLAGDRQMDEGQPARPSTAHRPARSSSWPGAAARRRSCRPPRAVTGFQQHAAWPFEDLRRKASAGQHPPLLLCL